MNCKNTNKNIGGSNNSERGILLNLFKNKSQEIKTHKCFENSSKILSNNSKFYSPK